VTESHVIAYARVVAETKTAKGTRYTAATQRSYQMTVQRLFRFLERRGVILQDPTLNLVLLSSKKVPRAVLNQAHARRLVASPDASTPRGKRDRVLLELCSTGRRSASASASGSTSAISTSGEASS